MILLKMLVYYNGYNYSTFSVIKRHAMLAKGFTYEWFSLVCGLYHGWISTMDLSRSPSSLICTLQEISLREYLVL